MLYIHTKQISISGGFLFRDIVVSDHFALCARIFAVHVLVVVYTWGHRCTGSHRLRSYYWCTIAIHLQTVFVRNRDEVSSISSNLATTFSSNEVRITIILIYIFVVQSHVYMIQTLSLLFYTESFFTCRLLYIFSCLSFLAFYLKATLSCSIKGPKFFQKNKDTRPNLSWIY